MVKRAFMIARGEEPVEGETSGGTSRTLIEHTYSALRDDILAGRLLPGSRLRIEHLRVQRQVGAGTVREALTRLVSDALVVAEGQRGFRVAPMAMDELLDITQLRVHIEIEALRLSIRHGDAAWRAALTAAYENLAAVTPIRPERRRQWEDLNLRFHETLLSGRHSPWTLRVLRLLSRQSERYRSHAMSLPDSRRDVEAEHADIYEQTLSGNEARAALALEAHIWATPRLLMEAHRDGRIVLSGTLDDREGGG